jgi:hypothetical protein
MSSYSTSGIYKKNASKFTQMWTGTMYESLVAGKTYNILTTAMIPLGNNKTVSAKDYFNGLASAITAEKWTKEFLPQ